MANSDQVIQKEVLFSTFLVLAITMQFNVIVETPKTAVVKASYLNVDFQYVFLDIAFEPASTGTILDGKGDYTFTSVHLQPPLAIGNPLRHKIIRSEFHRRTDVNEVVKATSLQEACTTFFTQFQDTFQIVQEVVKKPFVHQKIVAPKTRQKVKR